MVYFPQEIIENILRRLTIEAALPAKQVCKSWRIFLRNKTDKVGLLFAETNFDENKNKLYYSDQYDPLLEKMNHKYSCDRLDKVFGKSIPGYNYLNNMLGSCNGLVCIGSRHPEFVNPFLICNPITGEVVYIPKPNKSIAQDSAPSKFIGFGYCHSTNEYKIVRMHWQGLRMFHVLVYTIGTGGGWRSLGSLNFPLLDLSMDVTASDPAAAGIYANGALHWLYRTTSKGRKGNTIVAFNLEDEKFEFFPFSHFENLRYIHSPKLLRGNNLYLVGTCNDCTQIWTYKREITNTTTNACDLEEGNEKENYNDKNSWNWIKEYRICHDDVMSNEPLAITRNKELILRSQHKATLYRYDLKTFRMNKLFYGRDVGCHMVSVIPHANSIVSILSNDKEVQDRQ